MTGFGDCVAEALAEEIVEMITDKEKNYGISDIKKVIMEAIDYGKSVRRNRKAIENNLLIHKKRKSRPGKKVSERG